jgi:hypothetical protein
MADESIFGHSLLIADGDLVLRDNTFAEITGEANLRQALRLRILTPFGSDLFNTTYGLDIRSAFVEPNTAFVVRELIKLNLVRTLATDTRVQDVREILFEDDEEYRARHPDTTDQQIVDARHRRIWRVEVIIETATGESQTLDLSVGV